MKKILSLLIISSTLLFAQSKVDQAKQAITNQSTQSQQKIQWVKNFQEAITKAQKEHKPIIFIASKHNCKYCKMLKATTLKDKNVIEKINKNFIALNLYLDEATSFVPYMVAIYTKGFPTIWFLDPQAKALFQPIGGYIDAKTMNQALDMVEEVYTQAKGK